MKRNSLEGALFSFVQVIDAWRFPLRFEKKEKTIGFPFGSSVIHSVFLRLADHCFLPLEERWNTSSFLLFFQETLPCNQWLLTCCFRLKKTDPIITKKIQTILLYSQICWRWAHSRLLVAHWNFRKSSYPGTELQNNSWKGVRLITRSSIQCVCSSLWFFRPHSMFHLSDWLSSPLFILILISLSGFLPKNDDWVKKKEKSRW